MMLLTAMKNSSPSANLFLHASLPRVVAAVVMLPTIAIGGTEPAQALLQVEPTILSDKYIYKDEPWFYQVRPYKARRNSNFDYDCAMFVHRTRDGDLAYADLRREDDERLAPLSRQQAEKIWGKPIIGSGTSVFHVSAWNVHRSFDFHIEAQFQHDVLQDVKLVGRPFPRSAWVSAQPEKTLCVADIEPRYAKPTIRWGPQYILPIDCALQRVSENNHAPCAYLAITGNGHCFIQSIGAHHLALNDLTPEDADAIFGAPTKHGEVRRYALRRSDQDLREIVWLDLQFDDSKCSKYRCEMPFLSDCKWRPAANASFDVVRNTINLEFDSSRHGTNSSKTFRKLFPLNNIETTFESSDNRGYLGTIIQTYDLYEPQSDPQGDDSLIAGWACVTKGGRTIITASPTPGLRQGTPERQAKAWGKGSKRSGFERFVMNVFVNEVRQHRRVFFDIKTLSGSGVRVCRITGIPGVKPYWQWIRTMD